MKPPKLIRVAVFRPDAEVTFEDIEEELATLQKIVGGYIEMTRISDDGLVVICNEEGKLEELPFNRVITRLPIAGLEPNLGRWADRLVGTFFVCRTSDEDAEMHGITPADESLLAEWKPFEAWDITEGKRLDKSNETLPTPRS